MCARSEEYFIPETKKYEKMKFLLPCSAHSLANVRPRDVRYVWWSLKKCYFWKMTTIVIAESWDFVNELKLIIIFKFNVKGRTKLSQISHYIVRPLRVHRTFPAVDTFVISTLHADHPFLKIAQISFEFDNEISRVWKSIPFLSSGERVRSDVERMCMSAVDRGIVHWPTKRPNSIYT